MLGEQQFRWVMFLMFSVDCCLVAFAYWANLSGLFLERTSLNDSPMYVAFENSSAIYTGVIVNISLATAAVMDLLLDISYHKLPENEEGECTEVYDFWTERFFIVILNVITCGTILCLHDQENIPFIYICMHGLQFIGSTGTVLLLCNRLEPHYFSSLNVLAAHISFSIATVTSILAFGHVTSSWPNLTSFLFAAIYFYFLSKMTVPWLFRLWWRVRNGEGLTVKEQCCLWFLLSTVIVIFAIPATLSVIFLFQLAQFSSIDMEIFIYSFAAYSTIILVVPGRLAKDAVDKERRRVTDLRRTLVRHFSHEVRSPLNVICSAITFMESDVEALSPSPQKELLQESLRTTKHCCEEVVNNMNDLLQMETIKSGNFVFEKAMLPCEHLLAMVAHCGIVAREKGISFSVTESLSESPGKEASEGGDVERNQEGAGNEGKELFLFVDKRKIQQVLRNLITNAVKFTPSGKSVTVSVRRSTPADLTSSAAAATPSVGGYPAEFALDGHITVEVADTGAGISPENQAKVFGAFAQFNANELQGGGGTGLGLWISQEIAKKHGSLIRFRSEGVGQGTTFFFVLPLFRRSRSVDYSHSGINLEVVLDEPAVRNVPIFQSQRIFPESSVNRTNGGDVGRRSARGEGCKVLVVDDSPLNIKYIVRHIQRCEIVLGMNLNLEIGQAEDGVEAVAEVEQAERDGRPFDVVFMDNIMNIMNGPEAARRMRDIGFGGLIVGVTGSVMVRDVQNYEMAGADLILSKPISTETMNGVFKRIIDSCP